MQATITILVSIIFSVYVLSDIAIANTFFIVVSIGCVGMILYACYVTKTHISKGISLIIYIAMSILWGAIFYQIILSGPLMAERLTSQTWLGFHIPAPTLLAVEALGVMIFGIFTGKVWQYFAKKGKPIHDATKFAIGLYILAICYFVVFTGLYLHNPLTMLSLGWLSNVN